MESPKGSSGGPGPSGGPSAPSQAGAGLEPLPKEGSLLPFVLSQEWDRRRWGKGWNNDLGEAAALLLLPVPWGGSASLLSGFYPFFRLINPKIHPLQPSGNPKFHETPVVPLRTPASHDIGTFPFPSLEKNPFIPLIPGDGGGEELEDSPSLMEKDQPFGKPGEEEPRGAHGSVPSSSTFSQTPKLNSTFCSHEKSWGS